MPLDLANLNSTTAYKTKQITCKGCENLCLVTVYTFPNGNVFHSGNKCEKVFYNKGTKNDKGFNLYDYKLKLLFNRDTSAVGKRRCSIGIPKALSIFENFPFWNTLLTNCGIEVLLSSFSTMKLFEKGLGTIMSDSICFPAKLIHGHIFDLAEKKVDRIFYPLVVFEKNSFKEAESSYNCPIVSSYSDVLRSAVNTEERFNIPFDSPVINFNDEKLLIKACYNYLKQFSVSKSLFLEAFGKAIEEQQKFKELLEQKTSEIIDIARQESRFVVVLAGRPYHIDSLINHKTPEVLADMGVDVLTEDSLPQPHKSRLDNLHVIPQWNYPNRIFNAAQWVSEQPNNFQFVQFNSFGCGPDAIVVDECIDILKAGGKIHTLIRIDEITSTGSVRLRLRSMIESIRLRNDDLETYKKKRIVTPPFEVKDRQRIIVGPYFADIYSDLLPALFANAGYKYINLPKPDKNSVQYGLKYSNNEICYPATIIVGDFIKFLKSGNYKRNEIAVAITQTGGQCRASTYLQLIKKAMIAAGFDDIPLLAIGTAGKTINPQPGFTIDWKKLLPITFSAMLYADSLAMMYYATIVREANKGDTQLILDKFIQSSFEPISNNETKKIFELLKQAVKEFNAIPIIDKNYPKIGVVGEIYVKYNSFGHHNVVNWLINQGIETVVPPIVDFFIQELVNIKVNDKAHLSETGFMTSLFLTYTEIMANRMIHKFDNINKKFRYYRPFHKIRHAAYKASKILNLVNQFGEGWLIPAEIAMFAESGINNVISLQPFGCIANHVISKGVEKRIKDIYPDMNLLFLDFDDGTSEVNILNRLHFMVKNVKNS